MQNHYRDFNLSEMGSYLEIFFLKILWYEPFFKVFMEFVATLFLFYVFAFWPWSMWDFSSWPGTETSPPAFKGKVLTTGPQGSPATRNFKWKSVMLYFN